MAQSITTKVLDWYKTHARPLPWRATRDPYAIWVSEIMAQQTRIETVLPYYERWLEQFPTVQALAEAEENQVLKAWEGLGYYSRARNMQKAARLIVTEYHGQLPRSAAELQKLPGIGPYSAAAIASIAFGEPVLAVDGNVRRVGARLFKIDHPLGSRELDQALREHLQGIIPETVPGDFNQALMELGARVCVAGRPRCSECPLQVDCLALQAGVQTSLPVSPERPTVPHYLVTAAVIEEHGKVLLAKRPEQGLLGGMWEYPGGKLEEGETHAQGLQREIMEELGADIEVGKQVGKFQHAYTHFKVTLFAYRCRVTSGILQALVAQEIQWVAISDLEQYPMGKIDRLISRRLGNTE